MRNTRRQILLHEAIRLFAERGFDATPTAEIASRAGVAEGTLFHHFKSKADILREILFDVDERYFEEVCRPVEKCATGAEALTALVSAHFRFAEENGREMRVLIRDFPYSLLEPEARGYEDVVARFRRNFGLVCRCLERGARDGTLRTVPVAETAHILRGLLFGAIRMRLLDPLKPPDPSRAAVDLCLRGLAATSSDTESGSPGSVASSTTVSRV